MKDIITTYTDQDKPNHPIVKAIKALGIHDFKVHHRQYLGWEVELLDVERSVCFDGKFLGFSISTALRRLNNPSYFSSKGIKTIFLY